MNSHPDRIPMTRFGRMAAKILIVLGGTVVLLMVLQPG